MDRHRTQEVAIALLAVAAVVLTATAAVPVFTQSHGGDRPPMIQSTSGEATQTDAEPLIPLQPILLTILVIGLLAIGAQFLSEPWKTLQQVLGVALFVGIAIGFVRLLASADPPESDIPLAQPNTTATPTPSGPAGFGHGAGDPLALPVSAVAVVALLVVVLGVVPLLLWRSDTVRSTLGLGVEETESEAELDAIGQIAGDAADRIEAASAPQAADNAVYRAWREMVSLLDAPDPQSGTPRQFAEAAIEAGMDPDDVAVLTQTFEEVRYGDAALSAARRESAIGALRRIQATHEEGEE